MGQIVDIAGFLQDKLQVWAQPRGGDASVVYDIEELWQTAFKANDKPRILICYMGETIRGEFPVAAALHRVDRQWAVAVTRGRGFTVERGSPLIASNQNAQPFYDSVEEIRDLIRCLVGITEELPVDYNSITPMQSQDGLIMAGYLISFGTANDLCGIVSQPDTLAADPLSGPPLDDPNSIPNNT